MAERLSIERNVPNHWIDETAFPDAAVWDYYWTSSAPYMDIAGEVWTVSFSGAYASSSHADEEHLVRCIR